MNYKYVNLVLLSIILLTSCAGVEGSSNGSVCEGGTKTAEFSYTGEKHIFVKPTPSWQWSRVDRIGTKDTHLFLSTGMQPKVHGLYFLDDVLVEDEWVRATDVGGQIYAHEVLSLGGHIVAHGHQELSFGENRENEFCVNSEGDLFHRTSKER